MAKVINPGIQNSLMDSGVIQRLPEGWARFREGKRGGGNGPYCKGQGGKKYNMARSK